MDFLILHNFFNNNYKNLQFFIFRILISIFYFIFLFLTLIQTIYFIIIKHFIFQFIYIIRINFFYFLFFTCFFSKLHEFCRLLIIWLILYFNVWSINPWFLWQINIFFIRYDLDKIYILIKIFNFNFFLLLCSRLSAFLLLLKRVIILLSII